MTAEQSPTPDPRNKNDWLIPIGGLVGFGVADVLTIAGPVQESLSPVMKAALGAVCIAGAFGLGLVEARLLNQRRALKNTLAESNAEEQNNSEDQTIEP